MQRFEKLWDVLDTRESKCVSDLNVKLAEVRSAIGFQVRLFKEIQDRIAKHQGRLYRQHNAMIFGLFVRNCHYFVASEILAKYGLLSACSNNLRTVYETILMMYYLKFQPSEWKLILKTTAVRVGGRTEQQLKNKNYYSHKFLLNNLYDGRRKKV